MFKIKEFPIKDYKIENPILREEVGFRRYNSFKRNKKLIDNILIKKSLNINLNFGEQFKLILDCPVNRKIFLDNIKKNFYEIEKTNNLEFKNIYIFENPKRLINFDEKNIDEFKHYLFNSNFDYLNVKELTRKLKHYFSENSETSSKNKINWFEKMISKSIITETNSLFIFYDYLNMFISKLLLIEYLKTKQPKKTLIKKKKNYVWKKLEKKNRRANNFNKEIFLGLTKKIIKIENQNLVKLAAKNKFFEKNMLIYIDGSDQANFEFLRERKYQLYNNQTFKEKEISNNYNLDEEEDQVI